jgi:hypothetical protein
MGIEKSVEEMSGMELDQAVVRVRWPDVWRDNVDIPFANLHSRLLASKANDAPFVGYGKTEPEVWANGADKVIEAECLIWNSVDHLWCWRVKGKANAIHAGYTDRKAAVESAKRYYVQLNKVPVAPNAKSDRLQGVDCPDCEDGTEHSHSIPASSVKSEEQSAAPMNPAVFANLMQRELDANAPHKGEWSTWRPNRRQVIDELVHHQQKLTSALVTHDDDAVTEHAADIANVCMKAAEMFGVPCSAPAVPVQGDGELIEFVDGVSVAALTDEEKHRVKRFMDEAAKMDNAPIPWMIAAGFRTEAKLATARKRISELVKVIEGLRCASDNVRAMLRGNKDMQNREYVDMGIQLNQSIDKADAALRTHAAAKGEGNAIQPEIQARKQ